MIKRLEQGKHIHILDSIKAAVRAKDRQRNKKHQVWQESFDVKECWTEKFILQKLNYIYQNPLAGKWNLANSAIDYPHSSAAFYDGRKNGYLITDYLDVLAEVVFPDE